MPDLRMPALALAAWGGGLLGTLAGARACLATATLVLLVLAGCRRPGVRRALLAGLLVGGAVASSALLRAAEVASNPVTVLAGERAVVDLELEVTSDARLRPGPYGDRVVLRGRVREITGRGQSWTVRASVVVLAPPGWQSTSLGDRVRARARLAPAEDGVAESGVTALVLPVGAPGTVAAAGPAWRAAAEVRAGIRAAVAPHGPGPAGLVPALVVGDDSELPEDLAEDFRTTGLTHLLAVSGTNLTLLLGVVLAAARWLGVRRHWLLLVGAAGVAGFVLLARTEPSVVRAAAMGVVGLVGLSTNGRERGSRALGVAVVGLLLADPGLAVSVGFTLSALATAGILFLAPGWRDALAGWLPRWLAEAVAVPMAAQVACTPVVAALSDQVSLVAVLANLLAGPAVGPATVLGLAGGLVAVAVPALGVVVAAPAAWSVQWIILVAHSGADLPGAAISWRSDALGLAVLVLVCLVGAALTSYLVSGPVRGSLACGLLLVVLLVRPPAPGWPPDGWVMVACDVGQGDALVLAAGQGAGVVVDTGPDPDAVDACLDRLGITRVPLLVLTHPHADHVDGEPGVIEGRTVGRVESGDVAPYATTRQVGPVSLQVLWPPPGHRYTNPNDASVVLLAEAHGVRLLLTGDVEPLSQVALARTWPGLEVDVLKVPHHGSRYQSQEWLASLGASIAVISAGEGNDYGHPAPETVAALEAQGTRVGRTDLSGDVAVVARDGAVDLVTRQ